MAITRLRNHNALTYRMARVGENGAVSWGRGYVLFWKPVSCCDIWVRRLVVVTPESGDNFL
jgi:hypothetical protein